MTAMAARKKPAKSGGEHKTKRTPVQVPNEWLALARSLAAGEEKPTLWLIIKLIREHAIASGRDVASLPVAPWEEKPE